ncbi:hypothetical protein ACKWTF_003795 [Chironomus riparius]
MRMFLFNLYCLNVMKILLIILLFFKISTSFANEVEFFNTSCTGSEIIKVNYCVTSKDTFWVEIFFNQPLNQFFFLYETYRKLGKKFSRTNSNAYIDLCQLNAGKIQIMNFQKIMMNTFLKSAKMLFHPCPFEGKHTFFNITPPSQVYNVLMPGTLKFSICVLDATNTTLFSLTSYLKVTN